MAARKKFTSIVDPEKFKSKLKDEEKLYKLEMMGGDDQNRAFQFVDEYGREISKKEKAKEDLAQDRLFKARWGSRFKYHVKVAEISIEMIAKYSDIPKFIRWGVYPTKEGVVYWMRNLKGELFRKAIAPVGEVHVDVIGGIYTCIRELENTAAREKKRMTIKTLPGDGGKKTSSGIYLPN